MNSARIIIFCADYLPYLVAVGFVLYAFSRSKWRLLVGGLVAGLLARGGVELIRIFVHRPRPFLADPSIIPLISESSYSFPSGHAAFFFALATVVYAHNKRLGLWFYAAGAAIGLARVLAGVHYISDILGGAVLGIFVGLCLMRLRK